MATSISYLEKMLENKDIQAALSVIRHTEGTSAKDGYFYIFGSTPTNTLRFNDFAKHPNILKVFNGISSTAAGAYQILYKTYLELCERYGFRDFLPRTQDLMAIALFDELNVLTLVATGYMLREDVMKKLANTWASLPFSPYGQPTHTLADVTAVYEGNGGAVA